MGEVESPEGWDRPYSVIGGRSPATRLGVGEDGPMGRMVHLCFLGIFLINLNIKIYKKHNFKSLIPIITTIIDVKRIVFYAFF